MDAQPLTVDMIDIITPDHYAQGGYPHREWALLRKEDPVHWYDRPNVEPFWAITKHADIMTIGRQPKIFLNGPRLLVVTRELMIPGGEMLFRHLLNMDPPEHGRYRDLVNRRFTPRAVRKLEAEVVEIANNVMRELVGERRNGDGTVECDFVVDVAAKLPLDVIAALIGVPKEDRQQLFRWTNETIGSADPEFQHGASAEETLRRAREGVFNYFNNLVEQRRKDPCDDLTSVLAASKLGDEPLPLFELMSYFLVLVVAGNETTRNATTGGLLAFIEHPEQWRALKQDPSLLKSAVEEIVRWVTPVIQFARTASQDCELRGKKIREGDALCLFYPSANRDEEVFQDPFAFDIRRNPNQHIAFGIGEHYCLGANLARLELEVIFRELLKWIDGAELTGPIERLRSSFVGGVKHMPVRLKLAPGQH